MIPRLIALLGLAGVLFGVWTLIASFLLAWQPAGMSDWRARRNRALLIGLLLAVVAFAAQNMGLLGYPIIAEREYWWVVGIPFPAAAFDKRGQDFIGVLTPLFMILNAFFWFLVPQMALFYRGRAHAKPRAPA